MGGQKAGHGNGQDEKARDEGEMHGFIIIPRAGSPIRLSFAVNGNDVDARGRLNQPKCPEISRMTRKGGKGRRKEKERPRFALGTRDTETQCVQQMEEKHGVMWLLGTWLP